MHDLVKWMAAATLSVGASIGTAAAADVAPYPPPPRYSQPQPPPPPAYGYYEPAPVVLPPPVYSYPYYPYRRHFAYRDYGPRFVYGHPRPYRRW